MHIGLTSFFDALLAALYEDPLFREQISNVITARAAIQQRRTLTDILDVMRSIDRTLSETYTKGQFKQDLHTYLDHIEIGYRLHKFAGVVFRGDEDRAPELESIFVPLNIELQSPTPMDESTDIITALTHNSYLVLLGGPGSGKSTSTRYLSWCHAKANQTTASKTFPKPIELLPGKPVPLRIELRLFSEIRKRLPSCSFLSYVTEVMLGQEDIHISPQMFQELLKRRAMFVLFDGLDEVPALSERRQFVEEIENFTDRYPGNYILVTSRPVGYELVQITNPLFQQVRVQDFNDEQIRQFLERWYTYVLKFPSFPSAIQQELDIFYINLTKNSHLHKLAVNPLLLTVMTALNRYERLPDKRVLIYEKCSDLLLDTWARLKYEERTSWKELKMGKQDQGACIAYLGFILHQRSQEFISNERRSITKEPDDRAVDVPASFIRGAIRQFLKDQDLLSGAERNAEADRFLELVQKEAGLIVSRGTDETGEALYGFVHRTFQEYFAAIHIFNLQQEGDTTYIPQFLKLYVHDPHWHEVILLLFGKLPHKLATAQLRQILLEGSNQSKDIEFLQQDLFFVCACLADGISTEERFAEEVLSSLMKVVEETPFPSTLKVAAIALVTLLRTQRYSKLSKLTLQKHLAREDLPLKQQIQVAEAIYQYSPDGSDEKREGARLLKALFQQGSLSPEQQIQAAQAIYQYSPSDFGEGQEGLRLLKALFQQGDLSPEQQFQVAEAIARYSPFRSDDEREALRSLNSLLQQGGLSLEQQIRFAQVIYICAPSDADEAYKGARLLITRYQQGGLSPEQQFQVAEAIYQYSPRGSDEKQEGLRLLKALFQQGDLSPEQQFQVAEIIYRNNQFSWFV